MPNNRTKVYNGFLYYGAGQSVLTTDGLVYIRYAGVWDGSPGSSGWTTLDSGIQTGWGRGIYVVNSNRIYVFGKFRSIGVNNPVSYGTDFNVAVWDGVKWNSLGVLGTTNDEIKDVVYDSVNDILYACGEFTQIYGVPANGVAQFNGTTWSALQGGASGFVHSMALDSDQNLYICGSFYQVSNGSGLSYTRGVAKWNRANQEWESVNGISTSTAWDIMYNPNDNSMYVCGSFSNILEVSGTFEKIARYNIADNTWHQVGGGLLAGTIAYDLDIQNNNVYVGGQLSDGSTTGDVMVWDGSNWTDLGISKSYLPNSYVFSNFVPIDLTADSNGNLFINRNAGGFFILESGSDTWIKSDYLSSSVNIGTDGPGPVAAFSQIQDEIIYSDMCYCEDAEFCLDNGTRIRISDLRPGHRIIGKDNEVLTVQNVFKTPIFGHRDMVQIEPGAISYGVPDRPLTLTKDHEIILDGESVTCHQALGRNGIREVKRAVRELYHVHVDRPGILNYAKANGGVLTDVWGNDNRLVGAMLHAGRFVVNTGHYIN